MEISDIQDRDSLRKWLDGKPYEWAQAIALRVALRVAPIALSVADLTDDVLDERHRKKLPLLTFRASFISVIAFNIPTADLAVAKIADVSAYVAAAARSAIHIDQAVYSSAAGFAAAYALEAFVIHGSRAHHAAGYAASSAANAAPDAAGENEIWESVRTDCACLDNDPNKAVPWEMGDSGESYGLFDPRTPTQLMKEPLWLEIHEDGALALRKKPNEFTEALRKFYRSELSTNTSFGLIADWYQWVSSGLSLFDTDTEIAIAQMPPEDWGDGDEDFDAIDVMDRVAEIAGWDRDKLLPSMVQFILDTLSEETKPVSIDRFVELFQAAGYESPRSSIRGRLNELTQQGRILRVATGMYAAVDYQESIPQLPAIEPASLEPDWVNGTLSLSSKPAVSDLEGADIASALRGLKAAMNELSDEVRNVSNIDQRFTEYLDELVRKLPESVPTQDILFSIAHNQDVLGSYLITAQQEWPVLSASKLGALSLQFERTMDKFPEWRAFKKKPAPDNLTAEDIDKANELTKLLAEQLEDELAREFINPQLPELVEELAADLSNEPETFENSLSVSPAKANRLRDLLESSSNILKRIVEAGMFALGKGYEIVKATGSELIKGASEQNLVEAKKLGESIVKWLYRTAKAGAVGGLGVSMLSWFAATFPNVFGWLEKFIPFFGSL